MRSKGPWKIATRTDLACWSGGRYVDHDGTVIHTRQNVRDSIGWPTRAKAEAVRAGMDDPDFWQVVYAVNDWMVLTLPQMEAVAVAYAGR